MNGSHFQVQGPPPPRRPNEGFSKRALKSWDSRLKELESHSKEAAKGINAKVLKITNAEPVAAAVSCGIAGAALTNSVLGFLTGALAVVVFQSLASTD